MAAGSLAMTPIEHERRENPWSGLAPGVMPSLLSNKAQMALLDDL
jgi:hypothetical protein